MTDKQEEILDKIRERVLERERELQLEQDKEANMDATLQALEEITEVPREEMNRIAKEIMASYENPKENPVPDASLPVLYQGDLPATVREAVSKLPPVLKTEFFEEYAIAEKKKSLSYLFWLIPPPFSCHYLYNRRILTQILYFITCGGIFIWWIVDFFRIPQIVQEENRKTARKFLKKMMKQSLRRRRNSPNIPYKKQ
ncbi:TM2 domain-containing protein [bacterium]|nr:TM2 domain-containing protein [bacterium]